MNLISRDELIQLIIDNRRKPANETADALLAIGHFERHEYLLTYKVEDTPILTQQPMASSVQCKCGKEEPHDGK